MVIKLKVTIMSSFEEHVVKLVVLGVLADLGVIIPDRSRSNAVDWQRLEMQLGLVR